MNADDPNIPIVELVAEALGPLRDELVLVGGCSVGLLITDRARPPVRQTVDVDLVAEVTTLGAYYQGLVPRLNALGFRQSAEDEHMCRWRRGALMLDVMPSDERVLGHSTNPWYREAVRTAQWRALPNGLQLRVVSAPLFVATKLSAFHGRGKGDFHHHDMEDIVNLVDGGVELAEEVDAASHEVRDFIREEIEDLILQAHFIDQLPAHFQPDAANQARVPLLIGRLRQLAGL